MTIAIKLLGFVALSFVLALGIEEVRERLMRRRAPKMQPLPHLIGSYGVCRMCGKAGFPTGPCPSKGRP